MNPVRTHSTIRGNAHPHRAGLTGALRASLPSPLPALRRGMTGQAVRELQRRLQVLGYLTATDVASGPGVFGPRTDEAVKQFQSDHGIKQTGVVGDCTRSALGMKT